MKDYCPLNYILPILKLLPGNNLNVFVNLTTTKNVVVQFPNEK